MVALSCFCIGVAAPSGAVTLLDPVFTFNAPTATTGDQFGSSVTIFDDKILIGAPQADTNGVSNSGAAYMYDLNTGGLHAVLSQPNPQVSANFGYSVSMSADQVAVGAYRANASGVSSAGVVYVFGTDSGALNYQVSAPAPETSGYFAQSVALSDEDLVVGAPRHWLEYVGPSGAAFHFAADTGTARGELTNPDPTGADFFGTSVAVSGGYAVVGAYGDDPDGAASAGSAYVYDTATGAQVSTLTSPEPAAYSYFGKSVSLSNGYVLVGAYGADPGGISSAGAAYVYDAITGALVSTLLSPEPERFDWFGYAVSISGDYALIGAHRADPYGISNAGAAYVYNIHDGALLATLTAPDPERSDYFGYAVSLSGTMALVGAYGADAGYLFDLSHVVQSASVVATPIPSGILLLMSGLLAGGYLTRSRQKRDLQARKMGAQDTAL
ncbi:hypothetical protein BFP70_05190 [Thioclava sp. SK-1]|nr:hypothetical protein BFP70_05190 [Thioclava sp. SK-1]